MASAKSGKLESGAAKAKKRTAAGKAPAKTAPAPACKSASRRRPKGVQDNPVASFNAPGYWEEGASVKQGATGAGRGASARQGDSGKAVPAKGGVNAGARRGSSGRATGAAAKAAGSAGVSSRSRSGGNPSSRGSASGSAAAKGASAKASSGRSRSKRKPKGVQENPLAGFNEEIFQTNLPAGAFSAPESQAKQRTATRGQEVYDEYDLPPEKRTAARGQEVYDEYDLPPEKRATVRGQDIYDEYDLPEEKRARNGRGGRRRNRGFGVLNLFLLLAILALSGIGAWRTMEYQALAEMKAVISSQTFYPGTTVEGIDVSSMSLEQALDYWENQVEPFYSQTVVTLDSGAKVTAAQLGYSSDYASVLTRAWNTGRRGSLEQRYLLASAGNGRAYRVERVQYDDARVRELASYAAAQVDAQPQDAHVASFDLDTLEFQFAPESVGYRLDQSALVTDVERALSAGGGSVTRKIETLEPAVTLADVSSRYGLVASAVTDASSSSSNRLSNIRLAMSIINGTRLAPGEKFSFNETVGERTAGRGFKVATAYSQGTVTEEVGGGICQVSTTLFNAAVKADLKINERHPHSLTVSYVDLGKDAAVDWGNKDLKFTNNTSDDIYLVCSVTDDKRLYIAIYGQLLPNGETITVEGVKTGEVDYETQYQINFEFYSGQTKKVQSGKKGYTAEAYKIRWDANGNEISREVLCKSRYSATPEIIEYGP